MIEEEKLSDPQQEIINLRSDRNYVIQGGAGTGKTVIALYRAKKLSDEGKKSIILVHNVPLKKYIENELKLMEITQNSKTRTFNAWITRIYKSNNREPVLKDNPLSNFDYDYDKMLIDIESGTLSIPVDCQCNILIDESQDFAPKLLRFIRKVAESSGNFVTCFIDSNQSIQNTETTLVEAMKEIKVESARTLDTNYRSSEESARVAKLFWSQKGIFPQTLKKGSKPTMLISANEKERTEKIAEIAARYNFMGKNGKKVNIGVFVNEEKEGLDMYEALSDQLGKRYIQYRLSAQDDNKEDSDPTKINFENSGVKIFTYNTIKGLDFDAIVIGDNINYKSDEVYKNTLYMTLTRAMSDIYICYKQNKSYNQKLWTT